MKYIIENTGIKLYDGKPVAGVLKKDIEFLDNTFKKLKPKKIAAHNLNSIDFEMTSFYNIRMLKQKIIYQHCENKNYITEKTRYYSKIITKELMNNSTASPPQLYFIGIDNAFLNLHYVEETSYIYNKKKSCSEYFISNNGYIINKYNYESMLKDAIFFSRLNKVN